MLKLNADVIAMDYDRTVAEEKLGFCILDSVKKKLTGLRGHKLMLVTGRCLSDIPDSETRKIFDVILAENGTILVTDKGNNEKILVGPEWYKIRERVEKTLQNKGMPYFKGRVILGCLRQDLERIEVALGEEDLNGRVNIEFNKEGLMILPLGWNKGRGAAEALKAIGGGRLLAIGDDLNDISLIEAADIKVAVRNAVPELKKRADIICDGEAGAGVIEIIDHLEGGQQ